MAKRERNGPAAAHCRRGCSTVRRAGSQGFGRAMMDPERAESPDAIRYEWLGSIGDEAMAVVERSDQAKGLLGNLACLVAQRGIQLLFISAADLAAADRTEAVKVSERLGRAAMNRL